LRGGRDDQHIKKEGKTAVKKTPGTKFFGKRVPVGSLVGMGKIEKGGGRTMGERLPRKRKISSSQKT